MDKEQFKEFLISNERATGEAVKKFVNGKIDALREEVRVHAEKHEANMEAIRPIIEAYNGTKVVGEMMKWVSSVGIGAFGLWAILRGIK